MSEPEAGVLGHARTARLIHPAAPFSVQSRSRPRSRGVAARVSKLILRALTTSAAELTSWSSAFSTDQHTATALLLAQEQHSLQHSVCVCLHRQIKSAARVLCQSL